MNKHEVSAPLLSDDDPRWEQWEKQWSQPVNFLRYDTVELVGEEATDITKGCESKTMLEAFRQPALKKFVLVVRKNEKSYFSVFFQPTILPTGEVSDIHEGEKVSMWPMVDAHVKFNQAGGVGLVFTFGYATKGKRDLVMTRPVWGALRDAPIASELINFFATVYVCLQNAMRECPEVFVQAYNTRNIRAINPKKKPNKILRGRVKVLRYIRLKRGGAAKIAIPRKISCPAWTVRGHMRRYANGTVVWVDGYIKGKERNNPGALRPKDYQIMPE